ncbi:MAG TPA: S8 family serine peptidase [Solirubrobacteraceae bacterium]
MRRPLRKFAGPALAAAAIAVLPVGAAAETVVPLPESNYAVRQACAHPEPGRANCLAEQLVPVSAEAQRHRHPIGIVRPAARAQPAVPSPKTGQLGLRPQDLHSAYSLPTAATGEATIALIDAYNDPNAEADLNKYSEEFGLPACTAENGCFEQVGQSAGGPLPFPETAEELEAAFANPAEEEEAEEAAGWGAEISLDIESAHATCQSCKIMLVEADTPSIEDLTAAETRAEELGATEISNSWGAPEEFVSPAAAEQLPYNDPGTVITASAGDDGYRNWFAKEGASTSFPASSPSIVAVGGTRLSALSSEGGWTGETVWNGSGAGGGGCSVVFGAASWQLSSANWPAVGCGPARAVADVSADADPYSGIVVRDTLPGEECETLYVEKEGEAKKVLRGWCTYGGTSLSSPIIASVFALAGGAGGRAYAAQTLYEALSAAASSFHDITTGSNGECATYNKKTGVSLCTAAQEAAASCASRLICLAAPGYDGPTGVGTPFGVLGFTAGQFEEPKAPAAPASPTALSPPPARPVAPPPPATPLTLQLTSLGLTTTSVIALNRHPTRAKVAFTFRSNMATRLRVTLARRVRSHGRPRWVTVGRTITISAAAGRNVKRLAGTKRLVAGTYRLTLAPSSGKSRSVVFHIG